MNIAVVGSRTFSDYNLLKETLDEIDNINKIVSGGAKGADTLAEKYAKENKIELLIFKPDWGKYGRSAGIIRNKDIVTNSDQVVAFWDTKSRGTKSSIDLARKQNKKVIIRTF